MVADLPRSTAGSELNIVGFVRVQSLGWAAPLGSTANSHPAWLHDPHSASGRFPFRDKNRSFEDGHDGLDVVRARPEDPNTLSLRRRVGTDIGEIKIQRDEDTTFLLAAA